MEYIANRQIYEPCMGEAQMPGSNKFMWWWYQELNPEEEGDGASEGAERVMG